MNFRIHHRSPLYIILAAVCLIIPAALTTWKLSFRLDTDYNVVLPMAQFAIYAFTKPSQFLVWNPYIGLGVPVLGDPSSLVFSPFYVPIFLVFGADTGLRVIVALTIIVSGLTMRKFLMSFKLHPLAVMWGAIVYELSGAVAAMISSGHIEKFLTYALTPLVFLILFRKKIHIRDAVIMGFLLACMYLSDDFYGPWFLSIFYGAVILYGLIIKNRNFRDTLKEVLFVYGSFLVFAMPKLVPFVRDILPHFGRLATVNPYAGSIHAWFLPFSYIIPWQVSFYDRPSLQRIFHFYFNWYEYYAFISPAAFLPLIFIGKIVKKYEIRLALVFSAAGALYLSLNYPYSPFYWLFHAVPVVGMFRVPQRIAVPLLVPLLLLITFCIDHIIKRGITKVTWIVYLSMIVSVVWIYGITLGTIRGSFEPVRQTEKYIAEELRRRDPSGFYTANFVCCMQPFLLKESIPILNYYYGWTPTYSPTFKNTRGDRYDFGQLTDMRPSYIIGDKSMSFSRYGYRIYFSREHINVWKTDNPTVFPTL